MKNYIKYKSFDVIGNGNYRRYVNTCKEKQEKWAAETVRSVHKVASMVKTIHNLVSDLQTNNKLGLYTLCQTVIENNTPPIDQSTVIAECSVSKKQKCQCIVLRCKGRGAPCIMVQSRFGHFVLMLWTVFKIDLVIKTIARDFIESKVNDPCLSIRDICDLFAQDTANINKLSNAMLHALKHVHNSLFNALSN